MSNQDAKRELLVNAIGAENVIKLEALSESLQNDITERVYESVNVILKDAYKKKSQLVIDEFPEEHRETINVSIATAFMDELSCVLIRYASDLEVKLGHTYSEFAHHAVSHLEQAYRVQVRDSLASSKISIRDILGKAVVPSRGHTH